MVVILVLFILLLLQSIAFFTLMERHVLGLTQNRFGPKKTSIGGLLQPIMDGLKLLKKENIVMFNVSMSIFMGVVILNFSLMFMEFMCLPLYGSLLTMNWSYFMIMILVSLNVYVMVMGGIYSKSKYSMLGGMRSAIASVGYEIMFTLNMVLFMLYSKHCILVPLMNVGLLMLFFSYFISILIELGRTPFDYMESESELVSGFNTEYSGPGFTLLFLKEYGSLLFFSMMTSTIFMNNSLIMAFVMFFVFVLIRSSFPRFRYDKMVGLMWLSIFFHIGVSVYCTYFMLAI